MDDNEEPSDCTSEEDDEEIQEDDSGINTKLNLMRKELSEVPFEDLHKLQDKVGSKVYDKALFGDRKATTSNTADTTRRKIKRANKNRPQEISSKVPVSRRRNVIHVPQKVRRDPRFDDLSGKYNELAFQSNYSFMTNIWSKEKREVQKELKKAETETRKEELTRLLCRMEQQEQDRLKGVQNKQSASEQKKQEKELVRQGKKPFFLKKSEQKQSILADRYLMLKESGKLEKHLARKRKKNASKDRRHLPAGNR